MGFWTGLTSWKQANPDMARSFDKAADLHVHTVFSDGTYTPQMIVEAAAEFNISCLAITDHDIVDGIAPTIALAEQKGIEVIPGLELSTQISDIEVHLLAYFIDYQKPWLLEKLKELREKRISRLDAIIEKLAQHNVHVSAKDVLASQKGSVGRLHIAKAIIAKGYAKGIREVFDRFLGAGRSCYVPHPRFSVEEAIKMIHTLGGLAIIAHPYSLKNDNLLYDIAALSIDGIEAYYPEHSPSQVKKYVNFARKYALALTGGSDHHGNGKDYCLFGRFKIDYALVEKLKKARDAAKK